MLSVSIFIIIVLLISAFCIAFVIQWMSDSAKTTKTESLEKDLITIVSHELRTPLTSIKLYTEMLSASPGIAQNTDLRLYTSNISIATQKMVRIVNNLLNVSCLEAGRLRISPVKTDLSSAVRSVLKEMKPFAQLHRCHVVFHQSASALPKMKLDPDVFFHIMSNLITNAIKYGRPGHGRININLQKITETNKKFIDIVIQDNGIGISTEDQSHMFKKFFRAKNATDVETEGTGVGLFVAKRMVELSGGTIWFTSQQEVGTTFTVRFPSTGMKEVTNTESLSHTEKHL